jgi:hypothetical protein
LVAEQPIVIVTEWVWAHQLVIVKWGQHENQHVAKSACVQ